MIVRLFLDWARLLTNDWPRLQKNDYEWPRLTMSNPEITSIAPESLGNTSMDTNWQWLTKLFKEPLQKAAGNQVVSTIKAPRFVCRSRVVINRLYKFTVTLHANRDISWNFKSRTILAPIAKMWTGRGIRECWSCITASNPYNLHLICTDSGAELSHNLYL